VLHLLHYVCNDMKNAKLYKLCGALSGAMPCLDSSGLLPQLGAWSAPAAAAQCNVASMGAAVGQGDSCEAAALNALCCCCGCWWWWLCCLHQQPMPAAVAAGGGAVHLQQAAWGKVTAVKPQQ
jgi:hypothetical protein